MQPTVIDIAGTAREFVKWVLMQALLLIGIVLFGLSAPLLFTVGMEWLVWKNYDLSTWNVAYFFAGPFACAVWMVFICYLADPKYWRAMRRQRSGEILHWQEDYGGNFYSTVGRAIWFMVAGFVGSILAEALLATEVIRMLPDNLSVHTNAMIFYAIAPFFVFAPVLVALLSRWIRQRAYSGATPSQALSPAVSEDEAALLGEALENHWREKAEMYRKAAQANERDRAIDVLSARVGQAKAAWEATLQEYGNRSVEEVPPEVLKCLQDYLWLSAEHGIMIAETINDPSLKDATQKAKPLITNGTPKSLQKAQESLDEAFTACKEAHGI